MKKNSMKFFRRRADPPDAPPRQAMRLADGLASFISTFDGNGSAELNELWRHWDMVMGEELAPLARPLGHRNDTLIVGADDHLAQQELSFQTGDILERVNAFLDEPRFARVQITLIQGRSILNSPVHPRFIRPNKMPLFPPPAPEKVGTLLDEFAPDTPLGRCYRRFVERFGSKARAAPQSHTKTARP